jgi:hypothetical protein
MKLSEEIADSIDDDAYGSRLTEWARRADELEQKNEWLVGMAKTWGDRLNEYGDENLRLGNALAEIATVPSHEIARDPFLCKSLAKRALGS